MEAKTELDIRSRRRNEFGDEFVVENPDREQREFDTDSPTVMTMIMAHIDWLAEQGCHQEAELMMLDWSIRLGQTPRTTETTKRIADLRKYFGVQDKKLIHQQVDGPRNRKQTITLFLEQPMGCYFTKATLNILHMENAAFQKRLHGEPILHMLLACNGSGAPALVAKYLDYVWLRKCETLEFNNLEIGYVQLRDLFRSCTVRPSELIITGRNKTTVTADQLKVLPLICPGLANLWRINYHGIEYDYRMQTQITHGSDTKPRP